MRKLSLALLVFVFGFFVFSVTPALAKVITDNEGSVNIPKTEVINDDLFIGAQAVEIAGTVNGDVFIGAQSIKITGIINGNLHAGANSLDLSGTVKGNVYAGAQSVLVNGSAIGGSLIAGAATVNVDKDSTIGGSILVGAGNASIDSQVKRSVYAGTGYLAIGSNAKIDKDLYYASGEGQNQASISESAKIAGTTYKSEFDTGQQKSEIETAKKQIPQMLSGFRLFAKITSFIGALIVGFLYFKFAGKHLTQTADLVSKSFWKSLGVGFLITISFIPGLIILLITVVGIPLAGLAFLALLIYWYLAKIVVGVALGNWLTLKFNWKLSAFATFAVGLLTIYLVQMLPVIGFIAGLVILWVGLGAQALRMVAKSE